MLGREGGAIGAQIEDGGFADPVAELRRGDAAWHGQFAIRQERGSKFVVALHAGEVEPRFGLAGENVFHKLVLGRGQGLA